MLIILDRDGVINQESPDYIKSPAEWLPIPGSLAAITQLNASGHQVVVATNQAGIGRGYYSEATLTAIHQHMRQLLAAMGGHIDAIYYCPHHPDDNCACRKPKPGMLLKIKQDYPQHFSNAIFVGDSWRDLQAASAIGLHAALVRTGYGEKTLAEYPIDEHIPVYQDLADFVQQHLA